MKNFEQPKRLSPKEQDKQEASEGDVELQEGESIPERLLSVAQDLLDDEKGSLRFKVPVGELSEEQLQAQKGKLRVRLDEHEEVRGFITYAWALGALNAGMAMGASMEAFQYSARVQAVSGALLLGSAGISVIRNRLKKNLMGEIEKREMNN